MKFVHAYVLCALFITAQMKGAEEQPPQLTKKQVLVNTLNNLTAVPRVNHTPTEVRKFFSSGWFIPCSTPSDNTPLFDRPLCIYPSRTIPGSKAKPHLKAFKIILGQPNFKEKVDHISKDRTFFEQKKIITKKCEPVAPDSFTFNPTTKQGYTTQVLTQLKHEINPEAITARKNELIWETQKGIAALARRHKQLGASIAQAEQLQQTLNRQHQIMHDDFVFIVNVLIDDIKANSKNSINDQQAIRLLFEQEAPFTAAQERFNMLNQDTDEYMPDFKQFNNCYGKLPITIASSTCHVYNSWWTSRGEPALATDLRTANYKLSSTQDAKEKEELQTYIANLRARLYSTMINHIRTFSDEHLVDINYDLAEVRAEEQKIVQQLQHILPKDVSAAQAIETIMGWPKGKQQDATVMAERLAKALV